MAAALATRLFEPIRRWSNPSPPQPDVHATPSPPSSPESPHRPRRRNILPPPTYRPFSPSSPSSIVDMNDFSGDTASEQTIVVADSPPSSLRPPVPIPFRTSVDGAGPPSLPLQRAMPPPEDPATSSQGMPPRKPQTPLPEDDGQAALRRKLIEISQSDLPERERAQRMHELMTAKWNAWQATRASRGERLLSSSMPSSSVHSAAVLELMADSNNPYKVLPGDTEPTYWESEGVVSAEEFGCKHYRRNVKLQCSTCERWSTCRFCHDEIEDHALVRKETKNMMCMGCQQPQPASQYCKFCGLRSARYYCDKCKLWDDNPEKTIYHCNDCGICRIGQGLGKDFFHCKRCGVCMAIALENKHRCIERATECDCPICGEFMFASTSTVVFMKCGHAIHQQCYCEHMKASYRCPTCNRSIVNMESQFRALDGEIEAQPLPEPYSNWRCLIVCNDCSAKCNVSFHFLGLRCDYCKSYNTSQLRLMRPELPDEDLPGDGGGGEGGGTSGGTAGDMSQAVRPQLASPANSFTLPGGSRTLSATLVAPPWTSAHAPTGAGGLTPSLATSPAARDTMESAQRAVMAAQEAIEVAMGLDHGDADLWEDEEDDDEDEDPDDYGSDEDDREPISDYDGEESDDDADDDEDELITLLGHI